MAPTNRNLEDVAYKLMMIWAIVCSYSEVVGWSKQLYGALLLLHHFSEDCDPTKRADCKLKTIAQLCVTNGPSSYLVKLAPTSLLLGFWSSNLDCK